MCLSIAYRADVQKLDQKRQLNSLYKQKKNNPTLFFTWCQIRSQRSYSNVVLFYF